jgi:hypothetical protein
LNRKITIVSVYRSKWLVADHETLDGSPQGLDIQSTLEPPVDREIVGSQGSFKLF